MAGYSATPLAKKLGIKPGAHVVVLDMPAGFDRSTLDGAEIRTTLRSKADVDLALAFCRTAPGLHRAFDRLEDRLAPSGALWIAWPKKASGLESEISEREVREHGLERGLVDNKICAVDEIWSGLRFVIRTKDRARYAESRKGTS